MQMQFK